VQPLQAVVAHGRSRRAQGDNLRVSRRVHVAQHAILPARYNLAVANHHCANRHLSGLSGQAGLV
jgi:hypothetical protein